MENKTIIDVWVADLTFPGYMDRLHRLAAEFGERHPEYQVDIKGFDFRELPGHIAQAAQDGTVPAIAECYFYVTQVARDLRTAGGAPVFASLEQAIAGRTEILGEPVVVDDIIPAVRDYYSYDGELRSMPSVATTCVLFSNRGLLDQAGVGAPPATWTQVEEVCEQIAADPQGPEFPINWANHGMVYQQAVSAQDGFLVDNANGREGRATTVDLASKEMVAFAQWWQQLHQAGHYLYTGGIPDWEATFKAFATARVAMRISSSNDINYMAAASRAAGIELQVTRFPDNANAPYGGNSIAGTSLWLSSGLSAATRDGALAFLQFMHSPEHIAEQHKHDSFVPLTRSAFALLEDEGWFEAHPYHRVPSEQLENFPTTGVADTQIAEGIEYPQCRGALFGDFAGAQDVMTRAMHDVLVHGVDPAERFAAASDEAQTLLDAYEADRRAQGPKNPTSTRVEYFTDAKPYSGADLENVVKLHATDQ